jgi:hypothetical protein
MAYRKQPKPVTQLTAAQFERMFPDEEACKAYLVARRWPEGVRCPRCGSPAVYDLPSRQWHWQCTKCAPGGSTVTLWKLPTMPRFDDRPEASRNGN